MIGEGARVSFVPMYVPSKIFTPEERRSATVIGTVVYINWEHKYFTVEYDCGGSKQRESFRFVDIGSVVNLRG